MNNDRSLPRYNRAVRLSDFDPEDKRSPTIQIMDKFFPRWRNQPPHRKYWEIAMAILTAIEQVEVPGRALGVGAGHEETIFILTGLFDEVHATDLYLEEGTGWEKYANPGFMKEPFPRPAGPRPYDFDTRKIIIQHMDGRKLRYPDNHFDFIFSSSSIEHFGELEDITKAMLEMERVLRPGGILSLSTEMKVSGPNGAGLPNTKIFSEEMIGRVLVRPTNLEVVGGSWDYSIDSRTRSTQVSTQEFVKETKQGNRITNLVLFNKGYVFCSGHLALRKPRGVKEYE